MPQLAGASGGRARGGRRRGDRHGRGRPAVRRRGRRGRWPPCSTIPNGGRGSVPPPGGGSRPTSPTTRWPGDWPTRWPPCEAGGRCHPPTSPTRPAGPAVPAVPSRSPVGRSSRPPGSARSSSRVSAVATAIAPRTRSWRSGVGVSLVLFFVGIGLFFWAYAVAVNRSRTDLIGLGGLFFLAGSAPSPRAAVPARLVRRSRSSSGWSPPASTRSRRWPSASSPRCTGSGAVRAVGGQVGHLPTPPARRAVGAKKNDQGGGHGRSLEGVDRTAASQERPGQGWPGHGPRRAAARNRDRRSRPPVGEPGSCIVGDHGRAGERADHDQRVGRRVLPHAGRLRVLSRVGRRPQGGHGGRAPTTTGGPSWSSSGPRPWVARPPTACSTTTTGAPGRLAWELLSGDLERELDGCYLLSPTPGRSGVDRHRLRAGGRPDRADPRASSSAGPRPASSRRPCPS